MKNRVKILIAEPSAIIRNGLLAILHDLNLLQMEVSEMQEMEQLKTTLNWQQPDILIVNPTGLGVSSLPQIKKEVANPNFKCIALQNSLVDNTLIRSFDETISLYDSPEQIKEKLTNLLNEPEKDKRQETLTAREKEIIVCVIKGMTNKQIADKLYLSTHTVVSHRRNISNKLEIHSTAGLTIYAIVNKLVELEDIKDI